MTKIELRNFARTLKSEILSESQAIHFDEWIALDFPMNLKKFSLMVDMGMVDAKIEPNPDDFIASIAKAFIEFVSTQWPLPSTYCGIPLQDLLSPALERVLKSFKEEGMIPYDAEEFNLELMTEAALCALMYITPDDIVIIPETELKESHIKSALNRSTHIIEHIPLAFLTDDILQFAVECDAGALQYIPLIKQTPEIAMSCVSRQGNLIREVNPRFKTPEMFKAAVSNCGIALSNVPFSMRDKEMCELAYQADPTCAFLFPPHLVTYDQAINAFVYQPKTIASVDIKKFTFDVEAMLKEVAGRNPDVINFVHDKAFLTDDVIKAALKVSGLAIGYLSEKFKSHELCVFAVDQDPMAICYVPLDMREAVKRDSARNSNASLEP